jgi:aspartyl-tRNA(Asn)/glutamyl-tRNA(Gln) amidotransferase subunit B
LDWDHVPVSFENLADLIQRVERGEVNLQTAKSVLGEMIRKRITAAQIIDDKGLVQIYDVQIIRKVIQTVITENPKEVESYLAGKETLLQWFFGQVMRKTGGQASPGAVKAELAVQLTLLKDNQSSD